MQKLSPSGWQIIALASQVQQKIPLACKTAAQNYALFRDGKNIVRALEDRCVHRRAPLSLGRVTEQGFLQCPYHGWAYEGRQGRCKLIPNFSAAERISSRVQVKAFTVKESNGFIWLADHGAQPANQRVFKSVQLPALSSQAEGGALLCMPLQGFWEALLDNPALVIDIQGVNIVAGNILGEPVVEQEGITVEWSAQWRVTASKNKTPSDFPLTVGIHLAADMSAASIELRDLNNQLILSAVIAAIEANTYVTRALWRWVSLPISQYKGANSLAVKRAIDSLGFSVNAVIPAEKLLNTHRYVSEIWHKRLRAV